MSKTTIIDIPVSCDSPIGDMCTWCGKHIDKDARAFISVSSVAHENIAKNAQEQEDSGVDRKVIRESTNYNLWVARLTVHCSKNCARSERGECNQ